MKVEINDYALSKNFKKLILNLIKTANKFSKFNQKKVQVAISFVDKEEIKQLNKEHRKINNETDVLSFPTLNLKPMERINIKDYREDFDPETKHLMLGDIIICEDVAKEHAEEYGHSFEREVCYLIVHGFLHLLGYDHMEEEDKKIMRALEEAVLKKYKITRDF
ncbi:MAG: rRNA maturation RNase YbeY [Clostridia bacterium]|nr:rRNA maturation RNase YbeY [Clostridia bacterium]